MSLFPNVIRKFIKHVQNYFSCFNYSTTSRCASTKCQKPEPAIVAKTRSNRWQQKCK